MFKIVEVRLGIVKPGTKLTIEYPYEDITILNLNPSCGCTDVKDDKANSKVVLSYTPNDIPQHLLDEGRTEYKFIKDVNATYKDLEGIEHVRQLSFTGIAKK